MPLPLPNGQLFMNAQSKILPGAPDYECPYNKMVHQNDIQIVLKNVATVLIFFLIIMSDSSFIASVGLNVAMTRKEPVDFFHLFFTPEVKDIIYSETTRFAEQQLSANSEYLNSHPYSRGHDWLRNPMRREEVDPLLAILLTMGLLGFPTLRFGSKIRLYNIVSN